MIFSRIADCEHDMRVKNQTGSMQSNAKQIRRVLQERVSIETSFCKLWSCLKTSRALSSKLAEDLCYYFSTLVQLELT